MARAKRATTATIRRTNGSVFQYPPVALILCAEKSREEVELLRLDEDRINVAEYWTKLPPRHLLEEKLHRAVLDAKTRFGNANTDNAPRAEKLRKVAELIQQEPPAKDALRELLENEKQITPAQVRYRLHLIPKQLRRLVRRGQRQGWLQVEGTGRATVYRLQDKEAAQ